MSNRFFSDHPVLEPDDDDDDEPKRRPARTEEEQSIRDEIIADRKRITTEWRKYLLDWLESPFHQDGDDRIHGIEMTISPNGAVIFLVNLDHEGSEQVRFTIDDGSGR
jgi:hypothetical protein